MISGFLAAWKGYYLESYSQEGEDMILRRIFDGQESGFYVDIGAHHPKRFSNTYFFYRQGWRGINIDAMPGSMKKFHKIRPRDINLEIAISDKKETLTYLVFNEPALNGFSTDLSAQKNTEKGYRLICKTEIETELLSAVLDQYLPAGQTIDFLNIDVEGLDFKVLTSNNWDKYRPRYILIEAQDFRFDNIRNDEICRYLNQKDYKLFAKTYLTLIFKSSTETL